MQFTQEIHTKLKRNIYFGDVITCHIPRKQDYMYDLKFYNLKPVLTTYRQKKKELFFFLKKNYVHLSKGHLGNKIFYFENKGKVIQTHYNTQ